MTQHLTLKEAYTAPKTYRLMMEIGKMGYDPDFPELGEHYIDVQTLDIVVHKPTLWAFLVAIPPQFGGYELIRCWIPEDCTEF